jgi:pseudaminic acid biosynthesis-associated methylase
MNFKTEQEEFWAGNFGTEYIERNKSESYFISNVNFFTQALKSIEPPNSCIEFGANIGLNLKAMKFLFPNMLIKGVEINSDASKHLKKLIGEENTIESSLFNYHSTDKVDISLIKGVLIHINPNKLNLAYEKLYNASKKYILICEYYNPTPVAIDYRGYENKLFKRDFAGEMMNLYSDLKLRDYGFIYHRDPKFPQDDVTWFLLEKNKANAENQIV